jgi:hypothetical protein
MDNYGYIYKTTNLINGRLYIGQHKGLFQLGYLGSGKLIRRSIKKYGKENFKLEVLAFATTKDMLNSLEIKHIYEYRQVFGKFLYNITDGGEGHSGPLSEKHKRNVIEGHRAKNNCNCFVCRAKRNKLPREVRTCMRKNCNITFEVSIHSKRRYCSRDCSNKDSIGVLNRVEHEIRKCANKECNNTFDVRIGSKRKYCSNNCIHIGKVPWNKLPLEIRYCKACKRAKEVTINSSWQYCRGHRSNIKLTINKDKNE